MEKGSGKAKKLTPRKEDFCHFYITERCATKAAVKAGYSVKTARTIGSRLLTNVDIRNRIKELLEPDDIKRELLRVQLLNSMKGVAFSNIGNIIKELSETNGISWEDWETLPDSAKACIQEVEINEVEVAEGMTKRRIKFKLYDSAKMQAKLYELCGFNAAQKVEVTEKKNFDSMSTEELIKRAALIDKIEDDESST